MTRTQMIAGWVARIGYGIVHIAMRLDADAVLDVAHQHEEQAWEDLLAAQARLDEAERRLNG